MKSGHGKMVMAVMAAVMASLACSVQWDGSNQLSPSMTENATATASMTATIMPTPADCLKVQSLPSGGGSLNLRAGPGTGYAVRDVLADGQTLTKRGEADGWYSVSLLKVDGSRIYGFVRADYVEACP